MKPPKHTLNFLLIISILLVAFISNPEKQGEGQDLVIDLQASQFEFFPGTIWINPGSQVTINLTSMDVAHGIYIDGYDLQINSDPGQTGSLTFNADRSGTFRFRCSTSCGAMHPFMIGKIQVGPNLTLLRGIGISSLVLIAILIRRRS
jgi:heme/copper-type cytochrome/quinol oxidase subunit 2